MKVKLRETVCSVAGSCASGVIKQRGVRDPKFALRDLAFDTISKDIMQNLFCVASGGTAVMTLFLAC
jgi:hypothetical protein